MNRTKEDIRTRIHRTILLGLANADDRHELPPFTPLAANYNHVING